MKFVDEFRDPKLIRQAAQEIRHLARPDRHYRLMEVCGGHTHAIYRFGLEDILPDNIELVHGPGCPGVRPAHGTGRRWALTRNQARRHSRCVRGHDARAGADREPAGAQGERC